MILPPKRGNWNKHGRWRISREIDFNLTLLVWRKRGGPPLSPETISLGKSRDFWSSGGHFKTLGDLEQKESAMTQELWEVSANKFEVTIFNKTFKIYILTVHLEGKRHNNLLATDNSTGDKLAHTFLSALGQTTYIELFDCLLLSQVERCRQETPTGSLASPAL